MEKIKNSMGAIICKGESIKLAAETNRHYLGGADLSGADLTGANLREAYLIEVNLREADLSGANLSGADLIGANLREANLREADLTGANLRGADLRGAYLRGAKDDEKIIIDIEQGPMRDNQWQFLLYIYKNGEHAIKAGCRNFTINEYKRHTETYSNDIKKSKTMAIINYFEKILEIRKCDQSQ